MRVRVIVPRRRDRGHRDRVWTFCKRYWAKERPGWEIVEGDHTDGPFNRSAAINRAAEGEWDVAVILDADTILDLEPIDHAIELAAAEWRLVLPFSIRCLLNRRGTEKILNGYVGSWERFVQARQTPADAYEYISGCQVVARELWDQVGGFDERFEGWGGEDDAFHAACTAISGYDAREDRFKGKAWHLWHERSPHQNHRTSLYRQAKALSDRYIAAAFDGEAMRRLLAEDRGADQIVLVCLTTGSRDCLADTIASAEESLEGPIGRRLLCVDRVKTDLAFEGWDVVSMGRPKGYGHASRQAQAHAIGSGQPFLFWLEDDFTFNERIDLRAMQAILGAHPELVQLVLQRQPWYPEELEVGHMLTWRPEGTYKQQRDGYVEHRAFYSTNPMMTRRSTIASYEWPLVNSSERAYGRMVFRDPKVKAGILGKLDDPPRCHHQGEKQAGYRY